MVEGKKFVVVVPAKDYVFSEFALALRLMRFPPNSQVVYALNKKEANTSRNEMVEKSPPDSDYVLFLEDNILLPQDGIERLLSNDKDIVAALHFQSNAPFSPLLFKANAKGNYSPLFDYENNKLLEVDSTGLGALLVKRKVFDKLKKPYFEAHPFSFFKKAKEAGYKVYCDTSVKCHSMGVNMINEGVWENIKEDVKKQAK